MRFVRIYVLLFLAFAAWSVTVKMRVREGMGSISGLPSGSKAPTFVLPQISGGEDVDLSKALERHRVVLVTFWATWCTPCRLELPQLEEAYQKLHDRGLEILALSDEAPEAIREFLAERSVSFPVLQDEGGAVARRFHVQALPTSVLINEHGIVVSTHEGLAPYLVPQLELQISGKTHDD